MQLFIPPKHLVVQEFVDPVTYANKNIDPWWVMDPRVVWTVYQMRLRYNKAITLNNWHSGGAFRHRGFRPNSAPEWKQFSQHSFGRGADLDVEGMAAEEVRTDILKHPNDPVFQHITCIEINVNWTHFDVRSYNKAKYGILKVTP